MPAERKQQHKYKLTYFDIEGLAEKVRLAFVYANLDFEDVRIAQDKWPAMKEKMPLGQVPILEIDGTGPITQSDGMVRLIADKYNMCATECSEKIAQEEIIGTCNDIMKTILPSIYIRMRPESLGHEDRSEGDREAVIKRIQDAALKEGGPIEKQLTHINNLLKDNKSTGFCIRSGPTIADCYLLSCIRFVKISAPGLGFPGDITNKYGEIEKYYATQMALPAIKAWYEKNQK